MIMATYLVSYDLDKPGPQNYTRLESRLLELGAIRVLYSQWVFSSSTDIRDLERDFVSYINPSTDSFLVVEIAPPYAVWNNLRVSDDDFRAILQKAPTARYKLP